MCIYNNFDSCFETDAKALFTFGLGSDSFLLDEVNCIGSESSLFNCSHNGFGNHECDHFEDAAVSCPGKNRANGNACLFVVTFC